MKTRLKTIHEEQYSDGSKTLGVLFNYSFEVEHDGWKESFIYIFNHERATYAFFNTIVDMVDFQLYGNGSKVKKAYMKEVDFDALYDAEFVEGKFSDRLTWL
jgi:hypothetical protein